MLSKKFIIRDKKIFNTLRLKGKKVRKGGFIIEFQSQEKNHNCFGIVLSKRVVKKAALRNKIKRKIRSILFEHRLRPNKKLGFVDMVIVVLKDPAGDYQELVNFLNNFFV